MLNAPTMHWSGSFADPVAESEYRTYRLETDRKLIHVVCGIVVLAVLGYLVNDLRDPIPSDAGWWILLSARILILVMAGFYSAVLHRVRTIRALDALSLATTVAVTFCAIYADAYRPKDYFTHVGADVVILIGIYLVIPLAQRLRLLAAFSFSLTLVFIYFVHKTPPDAMTSTSVAVSLFIANLMGFLICYRHAHVQRSQYTAFKNEQQARRALEDAQKEIKSLSGLIPICSSCKSVRNDEGFWEQVESYVRDRSEAEFSHSLCPECEEQFRPNG